MTDIADCYFVTLTDPDAFFAKRLDSSAWDDATESDQIKALQMATAIIDGIEFSGYKLLSTQERQFPRKYIPSDSINPWGNTYTEDPYGYIYDSDDVPQDILDAVCLEALALLTYYSSSGEIDESDLIAEGVSSFSLGKLSMSFKGKSSSAAYGLRSAESYEKLKEYIGRRCDIR